MTKQLQNKILSKCEGSKVWKVGKWHWVSFTKKPAKDIREEMKGVDITDEQIQKNIDDSKSILNMLSGVEL